MAVYHLAAKIISRGQGHSAVAAAAYRAAQEMTLEREGSTWDYSKKLGVEHTEIMLPQGAPDWMADRERLWNAVENIEKRKDAQLAREILVAIPRELTDDQQLALLRRYVQKQFVQKGMVADIAIHRTQGETPHAHDEIGIDRDNPHAHIMLTMRHLENGEWGKKALEWNQKAELFGWREQWALEANHELELAGFDIRIDHRSYEAQGIKLEPGIHHGATAGRAKGRDEYSRAQARVRRLEEIQRRNADAIVDDPAIALRALTHQQAVFSQKDLARWASTHTADAEDFERVRSAVMNSGELIELEPGRYTSHEMVQAELALIEDAQKLDNRCSHAVNGRLIEQAFRTRPDLSDEQKEMVRHVLESGDLALVEGVAGAGKSWGLQAAREGWEAAGYRVHGAALSGRAAQELQESAGINSRSLASWEASWKHGVRPLGRKDVFVIDEAGMLGIRQLGRVMAEAEKQGAKVVLVGDTKQIQAIEAGAALRLLAERHGKAELFEVHRQRQAWQVEANNQIRHGDFSRGLIAYERMGAVREHEGKAEALRGVVDAWHAHVRDGKEVLMLAHERKDVALLNEAARGRLRADGKLGEDCVIHTQEGSRAFATGDRICFGLRNDELGVVNGTLGTVEKIKGSQMVVRLDGDEQRQVAFDTRDYKHLEHGFASTVHKAQGRTVDEVVVYAGKYWDRELVYVAMSRQRESVQLHWDKETFQNRGALYQRLGHSQEKPNVQDFADQEREVAKVAREAKRAGLPIHAREEIERVRREVEAQEGRGAHGAVKSEREDENIHDSPEAREIYRRFMQLEQARKEPGVVLVSMMDEVRKRHVNGGEGLTEEEAEDIARIMKRTPTQELADRFEWLLAVETTAGPTKQAIRDLHAHFIESDGQGGKQCTEPLRELLREMNRRAENRRLNQALQSPKQSSKPEQQRESVTEKQREESGRERIRLEVQVRKATNQHAAAEKAWTKFQAEHPLEKGSTREEAVESARLYKAEQRARAERIEFEGKLLKARELEQKSRAPRSPYDDMPANAVIVKKIELQRVAKYPEMTAKQAYLKAREQDQNQPQRDQNQRAETRQEAHNQYLAAMDRAAAMPSNAPPEDALVAKRDVIQAKATHKQHRAHELEASAKVDELTARVNKRERWVRNDSPVPPLEREVSRLEHTVKARDGMAQRYRQDHPAKAMLGGAKKLDRETQEAREELAAAEKKLEEARRDPRVLAVDKALEEAKVELAEAKEAYEPHRLARVQEIMQARKQERQREREEQKQRGPRHDPWSRGL